MKNIGPTKYGTLEGRDDRARTEDKPTSVSPEAYWTTGCWRRTAGPFGESQTRRKDRWSKVAKAPTLLELGLAEAGFARVQSPTRGNQHSSGVPRGVRLPPLPKSGGKRRRWWPAMKLGQVGWSVGD